MFQPLKIAIKHVINQSLLPYRLSIGAGIGSPFAEFDENNTIPGGCCWDDLLYPGINIRTIWSRLMRLCGDYVKWLIPRCYIPILRYRSKRRSKRAPITAITFLIICFNVSMHFYLRKLQRDQFVR